MQVVAAAPAYAGDISSTQLRELVAPLATWDPVAAAAVIYGVADDDEIMSNLRSDLDAAKTLLGDTRDVGECKAIPIGARLYTCLTWGRVSNGKIEFTVQRDGTDLKILNWKASQR